MKFKHNIEVQSGIADNNNLTGDSGQILSSTGSGVEWIDQNAITSASDFVFFNVKNETGSTISKGKGVMAVGTDGNSGHILIDEMVADGTVEPKYFLGVLEEDIPNGAFARVISFGQLDQFNTNGQNGETWADGQVLWCDPVNPGDFTITEPDGPNVKIAAAFILNKATNGKIQVRVQANEGIHDLHDTKITSQVDGDVLVWDNTTGVWFNDSTLNVDYTNSRVGIGTTSPISKLDVTGTIRSSYDSTKYLQLESNSSGGVVKGVGGNGFLVRSYGASYFNGGNFGIGTTSPGASLHVASTTSDYVAKFSHSTATGFAPGSILLQAGQGTSRGQGLFHYNTEADESWFTGVPYNVTSKKWIVANKSDTTFNPDVAQLSHALMTIDSDTGNVGIGTTSPGYTLDVNGTLHSSNITLADGIYHEGDTNTYINFLSDTIQMSTGGSVRTYINSSGNVGIGTTSPNDKLDVAGFIRTTGDDGGLLIGHGSGGYGIKIGRGRIGDGLAYLDFIGSEDPTGGTYDTRFSKSPGDNGNFDIYHNGTGHFSVNAVGGGDILLLNGNVGIGTTSPQGKLEVQGSAPFIYITDDTETESGIIFRDLQAGFSQAAAIKFSSADNKLRFYNNDTTAERMVIDTSGNVGIGTTSPGYKLDVKNTANTQTSMDSLTFRALSENYAGTVAAFENTSGINTNIRISDTVDDMYVVSRNGIMGLGPSAGWSSSNLNITSTGNVGIGNRNPDARLHVKGGNIRVDTGRIDFYEGSVNRGYVGPLGALLYISSTSKIVFRTGASQTEKMRLTDDGRLLLNAPDNASATNSRFEVIGTSSDSTTNLTFKTSGRIGLGEYNPEAKIHIIGTTGSTASNLLKIKNTTNTGSVIDFRNSTNIQAGRISMPTSTTVNYGTTSDYRLKTNVVSLEDGIEKVKKLKPSRFEWIDNNIEVDGFIAHEVAEIIPEAVTGVKDAVDENNNPVYQDLDYSKIVPVLTAALKEAIQKIEQLETRIQTLENND